MKHRNTKTEDVEKGEFIVMKDSLFEELYNTFYLSSTITIVNNILRETWQRSLLATIEDFREKNVQA